jgi:hypothetical protein
MEPEEMDLVELLEDIAVQPGWRLNAEKAPTLLSAGTRGMVVHASTASPRVCDVEFLDPETQEALVLASLPSDQLRVVERDTLGMP